MQERWLVYVGGARGLVGGYPTLDDATAMGKRIARQVDVKVEVRPNPEAVARALGVWDEGFVRQLRMAQRDDVLGLLRR